MKLRNALVMMVCLSLTSVAFGQRKTLSVGDQAPGFDIEKWVQGDEVAIEPGSVYVVEFWATWCVPCRKSIPHLNEIYKTYKDKGLHIIGVSDEEVDTVSKFVRQQGSKMTYTVAVDRKKATNRAWMKAAKQNGIPAAFIVDTRGRIAFIGHPLDDQFESILRRTLQGRYDPKLEKAAKPMLEASRQARKFRNWQQVYTQLDEVIKLDPTVFADVARQKFEIMLLEEQNPERAYAYTQELLVTYASDGRMLADMARSIAANPEIPVSERRLDVATQFAQAAMEAGGADNPEAIDTMALVKYRQGAVQEAIQLETRAWMIAAPSDKPYYKRILETYRASNERAERSVG